MRARFAGADELAVGQLNRKHVFEGAQSLDRGGLDGADLDGHALAHLNHALELVVGALRQHAPAVHDHDAAANLLDFLHVMAGIHHRGALVAQAADALQDGVAALGVDRHRGLVKKDELGLVRDTAGNVEPASQTARELAGAELGKVAQPDKVDRLVHQRAAALAVADVKAAEIVDVLAHRELVEHRNLLRDHADATLEVITRGRHGLAEQLDGAFVVGKQLQNAVDGRGLARAVGAQQAKDLAGSDAQVKVVERDKIVIALDKVFDMDDVCHEEALLSVVVWYGCIIAGARGAHQ